MNKKNIASLEQQFFLVADVEWRQRLIDSVVNAVYIDHNRSVLIFHYKDGSKAILLTDMERLNLASVNPLKNVRFEYLNSYLTFFFLEDTTENTFSSRHMGAGAETGDGRKLGTRLLPTRPGMIINIWKEGLK